MKIKKKLSYKVSGNITVFPSEHGPSIDRLKYGILALSASRKNAIK